MDLSAVCAEAPAGKHVTLLAASLCGMGCAVWGVRAAVSRLPAGRRGEKGEGHMML